MTDSPEDIYWALADEAQKHGIARSQLGQLAKIANGFANAINILKSALKTKKPKTYLCAVTASMKRELAAPLAQPNNEPEIALIARLNGWPVRKSVRSNGEPCWWIAGTMYDRKGIDVGG